MLIIVTKYLLPKFEKKNILLAYFLKISSNNENF